VPTWRMARSAGTYSTVILDVDGTLIDSNDAHAHAWVDALSEFGYKTPFEELRALIGKGGDKVLPETIGILKDSRAGKQIADRRTQIFQDTYFRTLRPFPGVRDLLLRMRTEGLRLVVASSANGDELRGLLDIAGVYDLLEETTSSSDAASSKPDPDIVLAALRKAGVSASDAVMVGDTPYDVAAARRAGVHAIGFRCGGWSDADLGDAIAVYDGPTDLLARFHESPLARLHRSRTRAVSRASRAAPPAPASRRPASTRSPAAR
jgi:HAD superfamily hydrolase (TIGR01509 family)